MSHFAFFRKKINSYSLVLFVFTSLQLSATPLNNITDTQPFYTVQCSDKFYTKKEKGEIRLHLSPFYQHAGAARDYKGNRVPLGERVGKWNMSGLFFGQGAMPVGKAIADYSALYKVFNEQMKGSAILDPVAGTDILTGGWATNAAETALKPSYENLINEAAFNPDINTPTTIGLVDVKYEKLGLRTQLSCDFGFGLGISVKGGVVDYKARPNFDLTNRFKYALGILPAPGVSLPNSDDSVLQNQSEVAAIKALNAYLFAPDAREKLFKDVGLDISEVRQTSLEDMHMQLFWHFPYEMKEKGELSVVMVPYLSVGAWLPTGQVKDQDKAFSIDTGNGGFYGLTFEGSLAFDFPKLLQTSFGGGAIVSMSKEFKDYRVPSSDGKNPIKQSGFYPWKTSIGRAPGVTWYGNASVKADGFSDALSLYIDYIYTYHQKDTITLRETDKDRSAAFALGTFRLEEESNWKTQLLNLGLDYRINTNLSFGGAVQAMIGGVRVYKTTTIMGSMTLAF